MYKKILIAIAVVIVLTILTSFLSGNGKLVLHIKPAEVKYRDTVELGIGETKKVILFIDKFWTLLHWSDIEVRAGIFENNKLEPLSDLISIGKISSSRAIGPGGRNQRIIIPLSVSSEILPGNYLIHLQLEAPLFGIIGRIPLTIAISESADDVIYTPDGPVYRGNNGPPSEQAFLPVNKKTIEFGDRQLPFTYRDPIEMTMGSYKGIIVSLDTTGSDSEKAHYKFSVVGFENSQAVSLPDNLEIKSISFDNAITSGRIKSVFTIKHLFSRSAQTLELAIKIEEEENGLTAYVPFTISVIESPDDTVITPGGETYRSSGQVEQVSVPIP